MTARRTTLRKLLFPAPGSLADVLRQLRADGEIRMRDGARVHGEFDPATDPRWMLDEARPEGLDFINYVEMARAQAALRIPNPDRHRRAQELLLELADLARALLMRHAEVDKEIKNILNQEPPLDRLGAKAER